MGKSGGTPTMRVTEYRMSIHYGICWGPVDAITKIRIGEEVAWAGEATAAGPLSINRPNLFGGREKEGGVEGEAYFLPGEDDQVFPGGLAGRRGRTSATHPAYRGVGSIYFVGAGTSGSAGGGTGIYDQAPGYGGFLGDAVEGVRNASQRFLGFLWGMNTPFIRGAWATVRRAPKGLDPAKALIGNDANPAHIIYECLTNDDWGMGAPAASVDADVFEAVGDQLIAENFGLSLMWTGQSTVRAFVDEILDHIQATLYVHPATGKWTLKLLRDDYDPGGVPVFNADNARVNSFQRAGWGELVNEIVVTWTNPENEGEETVSVQNLAAIAAQGEVVSANRNYYGVRNRALAQELAIRDLRESSAPLANMEIEVRRSDWDLLPGDVVRVDYERRDVYGLLMRVMRVTRGRSKAFVRISLLEDVFSLSKPELPAPPGTGWTDETADPADIEYTQVLTMPYGWANQILRQADRDALTHPEALAGVLGYQTDADTSEFELYAQTVRPDGGSYYDRVGARSVTGVSVLSSPWAAEPETAYDATPNDTRGLAPIEGGYALIGGGGDSATEIALVTANPSGDGFLLKRGAYDTVPKSWPAGTAVWWISSIANTVDGSEVRSAGEQPQYKLLARTSSGALDLSSATAISGVLTDRHHRPSRPANVAIDGVSFGAVDIQSKSEFTVTWARRNRLAEDVAPLGWGEGDVAPEPGQVTAIRALDSSGDVIKTWFDLPGTSRTIQKSELGGATAAFIEVYSARDGLPSLQAYGGWVLDGAADPGGPPPGGGAPGDGDVPDYQDVVERPVGRGANICPDPFFQDAEFWNLIASGWASVSRYGSDLPGQMNAPKAAVLSEQWHSGSAELLRVSDLVVGLEPGQNELFFSASAINNSEDRVSLGVSFFRTDTGAAVGSTTWLTWLPGESGSRSATVTPPEFSDSVFWTLKAHGDTAWSDDAGVTNVRLFEKSAIAVGGIAAAAIEEAIEGSERTAESLIQLTLDAREERVRRKDEAIKAARGVFDEMLVKINAARDRADALLEDAIDALATDLTGLETVINDADAGLQAQIDQRVRTTTFNAAIGAEQAARGALQGQVNSLIATSATVSYVDAQISSSEGSQALINTSLQAQINALDASAPDLSGYATISYVNSVETTLNAAIAASETALQAQIDGLTGGVDITSLAAISYVDAAIATLEGAAATARANLEASFNAQLANRPTAGVIASTYATIFSLNQVSADATSALASAEDRLDARIDGVIAGAVDLTGYATVSYVDDVLVNADGANASARSALRTELIGLIDDKADASSLATYATITTLNSTRSTLEGSIAQLRTDMEAAINALDPTGELPNLAAYATISYVDNVEATLNAAIASSASSLTATFNTALDAKADSTELTDGLAAKADITFVNTAIADSEAAQATALSDLEASLTSLINGIDTSSYVTLSTVNDLIATETSARGTAITDLRAEFNADLSSRASFQYVIDAVADETSARIAALNQLSASIADTYATAQEVIDAVATETSARINALNTLSASLGDDLTALSEDVTTVQAEVDSLLAARLIRVSAGNAAAGIQFSALEDDGGSASALHFFAQIFGYGTEVDDPRLIIDAQNGVMYALNAAGTHRTFEVEFDTGRVIHRASDGTIHYDSANGGTQTAGLASGAVSNTDYHQSGYAAIPSNGAWATVGSYTYAAEGGSIGFDVAITISHSSSIEVGVEAALFVNGTKRGPSAYFKPATNFLSDMTFKRRVLSGVTGNCTVEVRARASNTQGGVAGLSAAFVTVDILETKR